MPRNPTDLPSRHWYENDVTRLRVCLNDAAPALVVPAPQFVIPAKAGIHALTSRGRTSTAIPPPTSTRRPHSVFPAKALPKPRYGAGIQRGVGSANFHTLVCQRQPACAIGMKMTLPALDRDFETHQTPQSSFPRRRESTHESGATTRQSRNRQLPSNRQCSAGACPPLGSGWGVAESAAPIRCTKPQLQLFIPWCAGASRHERLV